MAEPELTKGDPVIVPGNRKGVILASRSEEQTLVGFADGSEEQIERSLLRPATRAELPAQARSQLAERHAARLETRRRSIPDRVTLPSGEEATVLGTVGRAGLRVRLADGSETQVHWNTITAA